MCTAVIAEGFTRPCNKEKQTGCYRGQFCSGSTQYAYEQCEDCSQLLPETTTCCPSLSGNHSELIANRTARGLGVAPADLYNIDFFEPALDRTFTGSYAMLQRCLIEDTLPYQCDYLVDTLRRVRIPHIMLLLVCTLVFAQQLAFDLDDMDCVIAMFHGRRRSTLQTKIADWLLAEAAQNLRRRPNRQPKQWRCT